MPQKLIKTDTVAISAMAEKKSFKFYELQFVVKSEKCEWGGENTNNIYEGQYSNVNHVRAFAIYITIRSIPLR